MNVTSVRKISAQYHTKSGASAYLSIVCGLFLLCNCGNSSQLAMKEPPKCNIFNVGKGFGCVPTADYMDNHLELNSEVVSKSEELKYARSVLTTCQEHNKDITAELASCTGDYEKLNQTFNNLNQTFNNVNGELSQLKNPYRPTFTQRDAYVGAGGAALGVAGLWVCQKMLGATKKPEETIKRLEKKIKELEKGLDSTHTMAYKAAQTALAASNKAGKAMEVASRAETASKAGVSTHIIPQKDNGG